MRIISGLTFTAAIVVVGAISGSPALALDSTVSTVFTKRPCGIEYDTTTGTTKLICAGKQTRPVTGRCHRHGHGWDCTLAWHYCKPHPTHKTRTYIHHHIAIYPHGAAETGFGGTYTNNTWAEPAGIALMAIGAGTGLLALRRRRS